MRRRYASAAIVVCACLAMAACGVKGPLYLPPPVPSPSAAPPASSAPAADVAPDIAPDLKK
jgi:predicted small lipoprotein YifL